MSKKKRLQITPSFVISCLALFVAMSGTAVALQGKNSVNSGDIKNGSVKTPDLGKEAVQPENIGIQTIGPQQLAFHGVETGNLDDGIVAGRKLGPINVVKNNFLVGEFTTGHAQCPVGQVLLSGGVQLDGSLTTHLVASGPDLSDDAPRTWFGQATSDHQPSPFGSMSVFAVCLE